MQLYFFSDYSQTIQNLIKLYLNKPTKITKKSYKLDKKHRNGLIVLHVSL